ncbi:unnamed protein product [Rotaria sordida]|uniref:EamA domain-containing protein n=1 Tax=Rotaria sordida TaxID=392033 RepID=A0A818I188_9BILA|nr:unnamed protein product [Rotaria sordida]CAF3514670.1 unnamed protein product [Rotaria sordida]CAF3660601.1 unnamed protein product [Rotaria sordida]
MKQGPYIVESDIVINTITSTRNVSIDNDSVHNIDPPIKPLIDVDELITTIDNDETLHRLEQKCSSSLTLHSYKQNQTKLSSEVIDRCKGIIYALIGSCFFTCSGFIIKQLRVDFFDAILCRFFLQTSILIAFIFYRKKKLINGSINLIILQIVRTILATSGLFLFYMSYRYIPLPDLTTCRYTQVVWTAILSMIIFRERISISTILAIILTLTGIVLVAQPTFLFNNHQLLLIKNKIITINKLNYTNFEADQSYRSLGLCLALGCALSISFSMILNKKLLISKIPQSIIMLEFSLFNLFLLILYHIYNRFILFKYVNHTMFTWQYYLATSIALMQVFSSTLRQYAIKLEYPSIISIVESSDILFAIILQNLFTNVKSNWFVLIGSLLVTTSIFLVGINKFWQDRKKLLEKKNKNNRK